MVLKRDMNVFLGVFPLLPVFEWIIDLFCSVYRSGKVVVNASENIPCPKLTSTGSQDKWWPRIPVYWYLFNDLRNLNKRVVISSLFLEYKTLRRHSSFTLLFLFVPWAVRDRVSRDISLQDLETRRWRDTDQMDGNEVRQDILGRRGIGTDYPPVRSLTTLGRKSNNLNHILDAKY